MSTSATPNYPFSVTFYGKDIIEVRQSMLDYLADNVAPGVVKADTPKKSRKPAKKKAKADTPGANGSEDTAPALSADTDTTAETPGEYTPSPSHHEETPEETTEEITPEEHPNVSLAYNSALEQLMEVYNGSTDGAYEVTLLLEEYRVASFREIPEDRGVELLDKANGIVAALKQKEAEKAKATT